MDTLSYKTKSMRPQDVEHKWYVVDAEGQTLGRMASQIAMVLRGKHRPQYTPHVDTGDCVIVINAEKVRMTGNKRDKKVYLRYTGYPGGQRSATASEVFEKFPERIIEMAVRGMLPKNKLGRAMFKKMKVYVGNEHPHEAQNPQELKFEY